MPICYVIILPWFIVMIFLIAWLGIMKDDDFDVSSAVLNKFLNIFY